MTDTPPPPEFPERLGKSAEDYLEAIGLLCRRHGEAQVSDIASMLQVKKPSVTAAIRRLSELGLVEYNLYAPLHLTEKGRQYADRVIHAHHVLRRFMREIAGLTSERANEAACLIEHILTYEEIQGMASRLPEEEDES